jgi:hypothetical protein
MATVDHVHRIELALPGTTEPPSYGTPAFRVRDRPCVRVHEQPGVLVLWTASEDEKDGGAP